MLVKCADGMELFIEWSPAAKEYFVGLWKESDPTSIWTRDELTNLRDQLTVLLEEHA